MTAVKINATLKNSYLIDAGLKPGDKIVIEGTQALKDGQTIKIKP